MTGNPWEQKSACLCLLFMVGQWACLDGDHRSVEIDIILSEK